MPVSKIGTDEDFTLLKESAMLIGIKSGKEVTIGDKVKVRVHKVSVEEQIIIFNFISFK